MTDRIKALLDLTLAGEMLPTRTKVEYDRCDLFLPEDTMAAKRIYEYVTAQDPIITKYSAMAGLFSFDGSCPADAMSVSGLKNIGNLLKDFYMKPLDRLSTFEWQHATADYAFIIRRGVGGLIEDIEKSKKVHAGNEEKLLFLDALKRVAEALIALAHKCSAKARALAEETVEPEYKKNLKRLADALLKIPERPAESFFEAVLSIYVLFSYDPDSIGTLDRTLASFYFADIESGKLTKDEAREYLQELFLMLQARIPKTSDRFTKGGESHFCVGGYNEAHEDSFSELSMLILEAMEELPTFIPQVSLRWTRKLPREIFRRVMELERNDPHKRIAFVNDEGKIHGMLHRLKFPFEVACRYSTVGCNETAFPGGMVGGTTNANALRSMDNTFKNRADEIIAAKSFDEFFEIYKSELLSDIDQICRHADEFNKIRAKDTSYVTSLLFPDCIEKALPFSRGAVTWASAGAGLVGIVNSIDSLAIVKQFVYDEKIIDMQTLVDALRQNWVGYEALLAKIKKKGKFFGNDDDTSNYVAKLYADTLHYHTLDKKNVFGYRIGFGNLQGYNPHHEWFGALTGATPDGRHAGEMLKFGIGQSGGYDREGLTALLSSVTKCDEHKVISGGSSVLNIYLEESAIREEESFSKIILLLESYFKMGGTHFQLNYLSKEDLKKAKVKPEDYSSLRVRVSGFSEFFVNLTDSVQNDVIARTEHGV